MKDLRSLTSAINGAKSQGPTSPEGKARSARNAETHGVYAQAPVLHDECPDAYATLRDSYYQHFQPANQPEADLVDRMIAATWNLRRNAALQAAAIDHTLAALRPNLDQTYDDLDPETRIHLAVQQLDSDSPILNTYQRFQNTQTRAYDRAFCNLRILQSQRPAEPLTTKSSNNQPNVSLTE